MKIVSTALEPNNIMKYNLQFGITTIIFSDKHKVKTGMNYNVLEKLTSNKIYPFFLFPYEKFD